ncbi:hypothetical protein DVH05_017104 [Phytophthora capsici]|nr:hypothetical protein DVH05_017104 [Phytophthora capsici]
MALSVDFIYIKPGKTIKDVEGEGMFIGKEALMKYLDKIDLAALRAKKQARRDGSADAARRRSAAKAAKPVAAKPLNLSSPDDCPSIHSTAPVQRHLLETTPARLYAESQPHKTPPSPSGTPDLASSPPKGPLQADSPHATALSPSSNSEHSIGISGDSPISQRNLDPDFEEAELSSNASDHSEADNQPGGQVEEDKESSRVGQPEEAGVEEEQKEDTRHNDVNQIENNDDPSICAAFEPDAENDDGDEDDQLVDASDDDVAQEPAPPEMQFDDELLSALGGVNGIALGVVPDAYLKELGVNGWSDLTTHTPYSYLQEPYEPRSPEALRQDYPQLYNGASGPTPWCLGLSFNPIRSFLLFPTTAVVGGYCC